MKKFFEKMTSMKTRSAVKNGCTVTAAILGVIATVIGLTGVNKYDQIEGYKKAIKEINEEEGA